METRGSYAKLYSDIPEDRNEMECSECREENCGEDVKVT
jgi:hypothetical protein